MDYLCECSTDRDRREALQKLPPDLPSSYERILERLNKSTKQNQTMVRDALHWIVHAEAHLTTMQLLQALAVREGENYFDSNSMTTEEELLHWCSSLVRKSRTSSCLELAHFTVKEFLLSIDRDEKPNLAQYRLSQDHVVLAKSSVVFLSCLLFDGLPAPLPNMENRDFEPWEEFIRRYPFYEYAISRWDYHVHRSTWAALEESVLGLFIPVSHCIFLLWTFAKLYSDYSRPGYPYPFSILGHHMDPSALHWAACLALDNVCALLIQRGADVNKDSKFGPPLKCALLSYLGEVNFVTPEKSLGITSKQLLLRRLLDAGAEVNAVSNPNEKDLMLDAAIRLDHWASPLDSPGCVTCSFLDTGARISKRNLQTLLQESRNFYCEEEEFPPFAIGLISKISGAPREYLEPEAYFYFFQLLLEALFMAYSSRYSEFKTLLGEAFSNLEAREPKAILVDESLTQLTRFIGSLSKAIRYYAGSEEEAVGCLQHSLDTAINTSGGSGVRILLEFNGDLDPSGHLQDFEERTFINRIVDAEYGDFAFAAEMVQALLDFGASLHIAEYNCVSFNGPTALELAADLATRLDEEGRTSQISLFKLLWGHEKNSRFLKTPVISIRKILPFISRSRDGKLRDTIIRDLSDFEITQELVLDFALGEDEPNVMKHLIDGGDIIKNLTHDGQGILSLATRPRTPMSIFDFLARESLSITLQDYSGENVLHILSKNHDALSTKKLECLLDCKSRAEILESLNQRNTELWTPLALAIRTRNIVAMKLLLEAGSDFDLKFINNETVLHLACCLGNTDAVRELLKCGADTSARNRFHQTPRDVAISCGHIELTELIPQTGQYYVPLHPLAILA
jgi:hypothetical protein